MTAIYYNGLISAVSTNEQLFGEKITCAEFHIDISKTEYLVRVYTDGQTNIDKSTQLPMLIIYIYTYVHITYFWSPTLPSGGDKLRTKLNTPCSRV